jgi:hypothetical protein
MSVPVIVDPKAVSAVATSGLAELDVRSHLLTFSPLLFGS